MSRNSNEGFSLLELIIAVVILGLVVSPLLHMFVTSAYFAKQGAEIDNETNAASNDMEVIKADRDEFLQWVEDDPLTGAGHWEYATPAGLTIASSYDIDPGTDYGGVSAIDPADPDYAKKVRQQQAYDLNSRGFIQQPKNKSDLFWENINEVEMRNGLTLMYSDESTDPPTDLTLTAREVHIALTDPYDTATGDPLCDPVSGAPITDSYMITVWYEYEYDYGTITRKIAPMTRKIKITSKRLYFPYYPYRGGLDPAGSVYDQDSISSVNVETSYTNPKTGAVIGLTFVPTTDLQLYLVYQNYIDPSSGLITHDDSINNTGDPNNPLGLMNEADRMFLIEVENGSTTYNSSMIVFKPI